MKYKIFGVALDVLDIKDKILLKRAYAKAIYEGIIKDDFKDPYDVLKSELNKKFNNLQFIGKLKIPSYLTPKPEYKDLKFLTSKTFSDFFDNDKFLYYSEKVKKIVKKIFPCYPIMIGIDHSLSGGVLKALKERFKDFAVVIFDAHFDAISHKTRKDIAEYLNKNSSSNFKIPELNINYENYNCANFLKFLIDDNIINPENLIIVGTSDYPDEKLQAINDDRVNNYIKEYLYYKNIGVKVIPKKLLRNDLSIFEKILKKLKTKYLYISFDIDVALSKNIIAGRFFNTFGLSTDEIAYLSKILRKYFKQEKFHLIGLDFSEIDIHLLNLGNDKTIDMCINFLENIKLTK